MKKFFAFLFCFVALLSATSICYAGDIPESLLGDDTSQVFFGEIKSIDGDTITVIQKENIKGEFEKDKEITYKHTNVADRYKIGEIYLMGYLDENNPLNIWEVTSRDPKTLEIKNTDDMSKRMQEFLNDGKFEEKENERLKALESSSSDAANSDALADLDAVNQSENLKSSDAKTNSSLIVAISLLVLIISAGIIVSIRKNKKV